MASMSSSRKQWVESNWVINPSDSWLKSPANKIRLLSELARMFVSTRSIWSISSQDWYTGLGGLYRAPTTIGLFRKLILIHNSSNLVSLVFRCPCSCTYVGYLVLMLIYLPVYSQLTELHVILKTDPHHFGSKQACSLLTFYWYELPIIIAFLLAQYLNTAISGTILSAIRSTSFVT